MAAPPASPARQRREAPSDPSALHSRALIRPYSAIDRQRVPSGGALRQISFIQHDKRRDAGMFAGGEAAVDQIIIKTRHAAMTITTCVTLAAISFCLCASER